MNEFTKKLSLAISLILVIVVSIFLLIIKVIEIKLFLLVLSIMVVGSIFIYFIFKDNDLKKYNFSNFELINVIRQEVNNYYKLTNGNIQIKNTTPEIIRMDDVTDIENKIYDLICVSFDTDQNTRVNVIYDVNKMQLRYLKDNITYTDKEYYDPFVKYKSSRNLKKYRYQTTSGTNININSKSEDEKLYGKKDEDTGDKK